VFRRSGVQSREIVIFPRVFERQRRR